MTNKKRRNYQLKNGQNVPGATTILDILAKPALIAWANRIGLQGIEVGKYVSDKADIGTLAHAFITDELQGVKTRTDDYTKNQISQAENSVLSWYEWKKGHQIEPILIETPLVSEKFQYGGTIDIYAKVDGIREIIDLKTGGGIFDEHLLQAAGAYRQLLEENDYPVERARILNIPRSEDESFVERIITVEFSLHWEIFEACLKIYKLRRLQKQFKD